MPDNNEDRALREVGIRKKRYKRRRRAIIAALLLLLLVMGAAYFITIYNRVYESFGIIKTTEITGANAAGYLSYGSSIVKYSKDGAVAIDKDGNQIWNGSFEMADPIADACGKYVIVADRDGKSVHIFDHEGEVNSFNTLYDIQKVEVATQGVFVVLMEEEDQNYIYLYDEDGTVLSEKVTSTGGEGFPMDISLSEDGKKYVVSYLSYSGGVLINNVSFFNFDEVGQNETDRLVGFFKSDEGVIVPRVEFVNNDTVCAYKDNSIELFTIREKPAIITEIKMEEKIQSILYNEAYVGVVVQADGTSAKQLRVYDLSGKKVLDKAIDFDYKTIYLSGEEVIMYDSTSCIIMKLNGKIKFRHTFENNIKAIYPINDLDRYYLATDSKVYEIQLEE